MVGRRIVAVLIALTGVTSSAAAMTIDRYLEQRDEADIASQRGLTDMFEGIRDALYAYNETLQTVQVEVFCPPPGGRPMEVDDLRRETDRVLAEAEETPDFAAYRRTGTVAQAALAALNRVYECGTEREVEEAPPTGGGSR